MNIRGGGTSKTVVTSFLTLLLSGCSYLDFGGKEEEPFQVRFFWQAHGVQNIGKEDPANPGFDKDGNKIPPPEVLATYKFPDIHAGVNGEIRPRGAVTPTIGVELLEFKVPYLRWQNVQIQAGADLVDVYVGHRWTSIIEITTGLWVGRDFKEDAWAFGVGGTLIKF